MLLGGAGVAQAASTMVEAQDFDFSPKTISIDPSQELPAEILDSVEPAAALA